MKKILFIALILWQNCTFSQQKIELLQQGNGVSIRGLSVVNDNIFWVSGTNGSVGKSNDGGKTIKWLSVKGFEKTDFRDIEAFDENTAIIMAIDIPAYILKTINGGETWKTVYYNNTKGMFLDAIDFRDELNGIVVGDPIDGDFFIAKTTNGGDSWHEVPSLIQPTANEGEGCFASSGTNIKFTRRSHYLYVTGGKSSRLFSDIEIKEIPIIQGQESTGANSIALNKSKKRVIIVGGDFKNKTGNIDNCLFSKNGGRSFQKSEQNPSGYRSCVEFIRKKSAISCGLNGVDYSINAGKSWKTISNEGFHVCQKAKKGNTVYFAGSNGRIAKLID
jgi:photosystem II stability/assembly factor-like uncharacterized protein